MSQFSVCIYWKLVIQKQNVKIWNLPSLFTISSGIIPTFPTLSTILTINRSGASKYLCLLQFTRHLVHRILDGSG